MLLLNYDIQLNIFSCLQFTNVNDFIISYDFPISFQKQLMIGNGSATAARASGEEEKVGGD